MQENSEWPDPLVPFATGDALDFSAGRNNIFLVDISVPRGALPGKYHAFLNASSGSFASSTHLELTVWNITLPEKATLQSPG